MPSFEHHRMRDCVYMLHQHFANCRSCVGGGTSMLQSRSGHLLQTSTCTQIECANFVSYFTITCVLEYAACGLEPHVGGVQTYVLLFAVALSSSNYWCLRMQTLTQCYLVGYTAYCHFSAVKRCTFAWPAARWVTPLSAGEKNRGWGPVFVTMAVKARQAQRCATASSTALHLCHRTTCYNESGFAPPSVSHMQMLLFYVCTLAALWARATGCGVKAPYFYFSTQKRAWSRMRSFEIQSTFKKKQFNKKTI